MSKSVYPIGAREICGRRRAASRSSSSVADRLSLSWHQAGVHEFEMGRGERLVPGSRLYEQQQKHQLQLREEELQPYLSLEGLKSASHSCGLCGCNWLQGHVSLDCAECGGYALSRPCPNCDGQCKRTWRRNLPATHDRRRARWVGECPIGASASSADSSSISSNESDEANSCQCHHIS